jgi:membrane protein
MITLGSATGTRLGALEHDEASMLRPSVRVVEQSPDSEGIRHQVTRVTQWMIRGYQRANATDLASAVAFQALVAVVPMFLLLISVGGLFLQDSSVLRQAILTIAWILPSSASGDAFTAAFEARRNSGLFGALSLLLFAWVGTGFVSALARSMNRIYGVPNAGYLREKQRGFIVILLFAVFFLIASAASIVTTFFVGNTDQLPLFFQQWEITNVQAQIVAYGIAVLASFALFLTIYRLVPNAKQRMADVWPGAVVSAVLFLIVTLVFPIYLRLLGGANWYGLALGLMSLMVASFYAIAHVILFGAYINATWQHHRQMKARSRRRRRDDDDHDRPGLYVPPDIQAQRAGMVEQTLR